mgnify:CR=1 FL=1
MFRKAVLAATAAAALLATGACTPITTTASTSGLEQGQSARQGLGLPEREMLQPQRPNAAQRELPGLY